MKRKLIGLLSLVSVLGMCILPAQAYTIHTVTNCKDYLVFEGGIVDVDWEISSRNYITEGNTITVTNDPSKKTLIYTPTIYIPLGSKISLTQEVIDQGYKLIFATFDSAVVTDVYSHEFNSQEPLIVGIYKDSGRGSITIERSENVVGVPNGVPANFDIPFMDISHFGEPYTVRAAYNKPYSIIYNDVIRGDIAWLYEQGVTTGTSPTTFSPWGVVTRGQMVQFLWNYTGQPEPKYNKNPFKDVKETDWYYKAVVWAYENEITAGISQTEFGPSLGCSDSQAVTLLSRLFNCELPDSIYNERVKDLSLYPSLRRANMAHYFHFAYEYASSLKEGASYGGQQAQQPQQPSEPQGGGGDSAADIEARKQAFLNGMNQMFEDNGYSTSGEDHNWTEEEKQALINSVGGVVGG